MGWSPETIDRMDFAEVVWHHRELVRVLEEDQS